MLNKWRILRPEERRLAGLRSAWMCHTLLFTPERRRGCDCCAVAKSCKRRFRQMVSFTLVAVRREWCTCRCIKKPPEKGVHGCVRGCLRSPPLSPRPVNLEELVFCLQLTAVIIYGLGLHSGEDRNRSVESLSRPSIFCWVFFAPTPTKSKTQISRVYVD